MKTIELKTPLNNGETLFICHKAIIMKGPRVTGQLALTSQRLIWEKRTDLADVAAIGLLTLAGKDYVSVPVSEIVSVSGYWIPAAAGMKFMLKSGEELKFQLSGNKPKKAREEFLQYFNGQKG